MYVIMLTWVSVWRVATVSPDHSYTRPADVLMNEWIANVLADILADIIIKGWDRGKPAALHNIVTSLLPWHIGQVMQPAAQTQKLHSNGPKFQELDWSCFPLVLLSPVETYGKWGKEAQDTISRLASHLAIHQSSSKPIVVVKVMVGSILPWSAQSPELSWPELLRIPSWLLLLVHVIMQFWRRSTKKYNYKTKINNNQTLNKISKLNGAIY